MASRNGHQHRRGRTHIAGQRGQRWLAVAAGVGVAAFTSVAVAVAVAVGVPAAAHAAWLTTRTMGSALV